MKKIKDEYKLLVEWKGYPKKESWTWENRSNIPKAILDEYLKSIVGK
jgi:hypothetical protein